MLVPRPVVALCLLGSEGAELVHLFCKFEAYTSTIGTLSELADSLNSSSVADLAFLLEDIGHLLGIEHQGQHTENHRQRGHEDRAQSHLCCKEGTLLERHSCMAALRGVLSEEDGGLAEQADEHDETHLKINVVLHTEELGEEQGTHQSERHAEDDGQRDEEALVEGDHDEIDEEYTDEEDDDDVGARLTLLSGDA